uniref:Uncharacterized protein n=1 Tax=Panagrellus redivivus TaxID=6233 RepID=A0A7E4W6Q1_PANRE
MEFGTVIVCLFLIIFGSGQISALINTSLDTLNKFSYEADQRFLRVNISYPGNTARVFGLFELEDSAIIFELTHGTDLPVLNIPAPDVDLSLRNATHQCSNVNKRLHLNVEIELSPDSITVRSKNAERYPLSSSLILHEHFRLLFFAVPSAKNDATCVLPATWESRSRSENKLPSSPSHRGPVEVGYLTFKVPTTKRNGINIRETSTMASLAQRRATTYRAAIERRSTVDRYRQIIKKPKYQQDQLGLSTVPPPTPEPNYIDISKDKDVYEQIQKSMTREINSSWSATFIFFFAIVAMTVGIFTCFGLAMFVLLQCRPRDHEQLKPVPID